MSADALVIFGVTGDLARQMTFPALYRLERRRLLDFPIVGVGRRQIDDEQLRSRAREAVQAQTQTLDEDVFARLAERLTYVSGDLGERSTYERIGRALGDARSPAFYLETPPKLFGTVVEQLDATSLLGGRSRVLVEKPFGHDLASAQQLSAKLHEHLDESQLYRIDHFLGKLGLEEILRLRFANTTLEPLWSREHVAQVQITMAEDIGLEQRGSFYDPVGQLRDDVVNHLMQIVAAATMEPPAGADARSLHEAQRAAFAAIADADPERYVRGQYEGYTEIEGVDADSSTETFTALELRVENERWAGVPFLIRSGKRMAEEATELRLIFARAQQPLLFADGEQRPQPAELVVRLDPSPGVRLLLDLRGADREREQAVPLQRELAADEQRTPYEVLLAAGLRDDRTRFTSQESVEECWRIVQPLLEQPGPAHPYPQGSWGPREADSLVAARGGWRGPWGAQTR